MSNKGNSDNLWKAIAIIEANKDWEDALDLARMYYRECVKEASEKEIRDVFLDAVYAKRELLRLEQAKEVYKDLLLADQVAEALDFTDKTLFGDIIERIQEF